MQIRRRRRRVPTFIKMFVTVIALAGVSFVTAYAWQNAQDTLIAEGAASPAKKSGSSESAEGEADKIASSKVDAPYMAPVSTSRVEAQKIKTASEAAQAVAASKSGDSGDSDSAQPVADSGYARQAAEGAVPKSDAMDYGYFNDAIFFGDSISTGIPLYMKTMVPNTAVIAAQGVSPDGASTSQCIDIGGKRVTMLEAAKTKGERKKVYIMLGANALDLEETVFIKGYTAFLQSVKELYPDAEIYVQSILPVTATVNRTYPSKNINNERIVAYNDSIRKMALGQGVHYVDVAQCMVGADGMLPSEASPFDGMHLTPEYYMKWFDYLRTHIVTTKK